MSSCEPGQLADWAAQRAQLPEPTGTAQTVDSVPEAAEPGRLTAGRSEPVQFERPHPLTPLIQTWVLLAAMGAGLLRDYAENTLQDFSTWSWAVLLLGPVCLFQLIYGLFLWRCTRFVTDSAEFRIERSFIWHTSNRIPYSKIQSVDIRQPFAARLVGMAKLHIDAGGGGGRNIEFLSVRRAGELRAQLLQARDSRSVGQPERSTATGPDGLGTDEPTELIVRATPLNLFLTSVISFEFLFLLICQAFTLLIGAFDGSWLPAIGVSIPLVGLVWTRTTNQWNYQVTRHGTSFRSSRGLLTLASQQIPVQRVQGIRITRQLLHRPFGLWRVQMSVLGVGAEQDPTESSNVLLPAGSWSDALTAVEAIWPGFKIGRLNWYRQPQQAKWLTWFTFGSRGWALDRDVFASRRGLLSQRIDLVPYARIQGINLREGPLQRRLGLAEVQVKLSDDVVAAVGGHLLASDARALTWQISSKGRTARETDIGTNALLAFVPQGSKDADPESSAADSLPADRAGQDTDRH